MERIKPKSGKIALYILLLVFVLVVMISIKTKSSFISGFTNSSENKVDTLNVAVVYGPLSYFLYEDTLGGINYDLLREFEIENNQPLRFFPVVNIKDAINMIAKDKYNILASLPLDYELRKNNLVTESVFLDRLVLVQLKNNEGHKKINSAIELNGDTVYVQTGSSAVRRLQNLEKEIGGRIHIISKDNQTDEYLCMQVAKGVFPLAVVNEKTAIAMKEKYPDLSYENPISFTQFQVWVVSPRDSTLLEKVDHWLSTFKNSPKYQDIISRY